MKLFIQIPCLNEEETLPQVVHSLPSRIEGVAAIEVLVIDDGSSDRTSAVAKQLGVDHLIQNTKNLGLARTFKKGLDYCLEHGADVVVNIDADGQYRGGDISQLVKPIIDQQADVVLGDRQTQSIDHFSGIKKLLQSLGTYLVSRLSGVNVQDAVSGFRAFSRNAAFKLTILSGFTYTIESLLQLESKGLKLAVVPIQTNSPTRKSRLFRSLKVYLTFSAATIIRIFTMYNPFRVFFAVGGVTVFLGVILGTRFLYFYVLFGDDGKIQSLILSSILIVVGVLIVVSGILADLIQFNRRLLEDILERTKRIQYEPKKEPPECK